MSENRMTPDQMKQRTKAFGLRVIRLCEALARGRTAEVLARQLLRSGTGVGANYRAACRSRTDGDFLARMGIVEEEADEAVYWMELLVEAGLVSPARVKSLIEEGNQVVAIAVASINTVKKRGPRRRQQSEIRNPKSEM